MQAPKAVCPPLTAPPARAARPKPFARRSLPRGPASLRSLACSWAEFVMGMSFMFLLFAIKFISQRYR